MEPDGIFVFRDSSHAALYNTNGAQNVGLADFHCAKETFGRVNSSCHFVRRMDLGRSVFGAQ